MKPVSKKHYCKNSRLRVWRNLLFCILALPCACRNNETGITIVWEQQRAKAIHIPQQLVKEMPAARQADYIQVRLQQAGAPAIAGTYRWQQGVLFEPLIPFTRGLQYQVIAGGKQIGSLRIPVADTADAPQILAVYPQHDTVPENLLKIYISFSHPMRAGQSARYIHLIRNSKDTLKGSFLDLQPELWNDSNTVLTLWLDPGRIKRELQPNLEKGAPLEKQAHYDIFISRQWQDEQGRMPAADHRHSFTTTVRDETRPAPGLWQLQLPEAGTTQALLIKFREPMDHFLAEECIQVHTSGGVPVKGKLLMLKKDTEANFIPAVPWKAGTYQLVTEARLEDLAGNNLNRVFDRDITQGAKPVNARVYTRSFHIP